MCFPPPSSLFAGFSGLCCFASLVQFPVSFLSCLCSLQSATLIAPLSFQQFAIPSHQSYLLPPCLLLFPFLSLPRWLHFISVFGVILLCDPCLFLHLSASLFLSPLCSLLFGTSLGHPCQYYEQSRPQFYSTCIQRFLNLSVSGAHYSSTVSCSNQLACSSKISNTRI